ncbi:hypothetical protein DXV76_15540 [Rhodobacteraceae bacterium CCMM004]|nr:hypothetical protein DXV76_15540 [Rhodobacteraceae bacterium CCMM004]
MTLPDSEPLQRAAARAHWIVAATMLIGGAATAALAVWAVADPTGAAELLATRLTTDLPPPAPAQVWALSALATGQAALWLMAADGLRRVFAALAAAAPDAAIAPARRAARWMWAALVVSILAQIPASYAATLHAPPGARAIAITLGTGHLLAVLAGVLASFLAVALSLGAALWRDAREIV